MKMALGSEDVFHGCYEFFNEILPSIAILAPLMLVTVFGLLPEAILYLASCVFCRNIMCFECRQENYHDKAKEIMNYSTQKVFRMKPSSDRNGSPQTELFGYMVPTIFLVQVFSMTGLLLGYAAFTFIDIFFVK